MEMMNKKALEAVLDAMTYMGYGSNADAIEELNTENPYIVIWAKQMS